MKNIISVCLVVSLLFLNSCSLTDLELQESPNAVAPENAEIGLFFNQIQLDFVDFFDSGSNLTMEPVRMTNMGGGALYNNAFGPNGFNLMWNRAYADLIPDLDQLISIANTEGSTVPTYSGAGKVMKAYVMMTLVDIFGNVPFSEIGQGVTLPSPQADDAASVYSEALVLIEGAIADFSSPSANIGSNDLYYGGDQSKWLKFANTMLIKWNVTTKLAGGSGSAINAVIDNSILSSSDDFQFQYGTNRTNNATTGRNMPDSRHTRYINHYEVNGGEYLANYYMWSLNSEKGFEDPRLRYYFYRQDLDPDAADLFTLDCNAVGRPLHYTGDYPWCTLGTANGGYWGRDHGNNDGIPPDGDRKTCWGLYPAGGKFDNGAGGAVKNGGTDGALGAGIAPIMLSSFTNFMLAEGALTMGVNGDARTYLETGIRESMAKVASFGSLDGAAVDSLKMTDADVDAYVEAVLGNYDAASPDDQLDIVAKEYHIALWGNGLEAYNMYRRTGLPSGMQPTREPSPGDFVRSMFYPADYVNLNANASQKAITDQVFWDTNPPGFIN